MLGGGGGTLSFFPPQLLPLSNGENNCPQLWGLKQAWNFVMSPKVAPHAGSLPDLGVFIIGRYTAVS